MAWYCSGKTNAELINNLYKNGLITDDRVKDAMLGVDRAHYSPTDPYNDSPQSIGYSATISAPHMHASACESLLPFLHPTARVLDIGSGSGYLTHVLANLVSNPQSSSSSSNNSSGNNNSSSNGGKVIGIEHIPQLVSLSSQNMSKSVQGRKYLEKGIVEFVTGDGRNPKTFLSVSNTSTTSPNKPPENKGAENPLFDAIHVGAAAKEIHQELLDQLKSPGRLFIPVEDEKSTGLQYIWVVDKDVDGNVRKVRREGVRYVPLTDGPMK